MARKKAVGRMIGDRKTSWRYPLRDLAKADRATLQPWLEEHKPVFTLKEAKALIRGTLELWRGGARIETPDDVPGKMTAEERQELLALLQKIAEDKTTRAEKRREREGRKERRRAAGSWAYLFRGRLETAHDRELGPWLCAKGVRFTTDEAKRLRDKLEGVQPITEADLPGGFPEEIKAEAVTRLERYRRIEAAARKARWEQYEREHADFGRRVEEARRRFEEEARRHQREHEETYRRIRSPFPSTVPFRVLGLSPGATADEVKKAYRAAVKRHHPDAGGDPARFREIQEAYDMLKGA